MLVGAAGTQFGAWAMVNKIIELVRFCVAQWLRNRAIAVDIKRVAAG